jgi:PleD family two-component response regulator
MSEAKISILSVEDDSMQADWIRSTLENELPETQVSRIGTEHEFISKFEEIANEPPRLILLDAMLRWTNPSPDMPERPEEVRQGGIAQAGLRCQKRLSQDLRTRDIPVIFYTVLQKSSLGSLVVELPKDLVMVQKNADPRELIGRVRQALRHAQPYRA